VARAYSFLIKAGNAEGILGYSAIKKKKMQ
jgi:hypothetical protein